MKITPLSWDSEFFNQPVSHIECSSEQLPNVLNELTTQGTILAYYACTAPIDGSILTHFNGQHVDNKMTFSKVISAHHCSQKENDGVEPYDARFSRDDITRLALTSGEHSRFKRDPHITQQQFTALYTIWITRSLDKEIADEVLVVGHKKNVIGMVTLTKRNECGTVGLIAVDKAHRGQGIGLRLMQAAETWFRQEQCRTMKVVTQLNNLAACRLYQKHQFELISNLYYYHFWLKPPLQPTPPAIIS